MRMGVRKLLLSALAGAAAMLLLAGLWHIVILGPYYGREMPGLQGEVRYDIIGPDVVDPDDDALR